MPGSLSVHLEDLTFFRIKTHQPVFFPHLKVIQFGLQLETAILQVDCQVQPEESIVCEQVDFKNKDLSEASILQYLCIAALIGEHISNHNDDHNDNIKFIF